MILTPIVSWGFTRTHPLWWQWRQQCQAVARPSSRGFPAADAQAERSGLEGSGRRRSRGPRGLRGARGRSHIRGKCMVATRIRGECMRLRPHSGQMHVCEPHSVQMHAREPHSGRKCATARALGASVAIPHAFGPSAGRPSHTRGKCEHPPTQKARAGASGSSSRADPRRHARARRYILRLRGYAPSVGDVTPRHGTTRRLPAVSPLRAR